MHYLFDHFDSVNEVLNIEPLGLFTDVDGTISEIAPSPAEARVSPVCREALAVLSQKLALVTAVSGRSAVDTREMVGLDELVYIGNHGYERWIKGHVVLLPGVESYPAGIGAVLDELSRRVSIEGMIVENKGPTASIHYRRARDHKDALRSIISAIEEPARANGLKISRGKMVVELRPPLEVTKGTAVVSLIHEYALKGAIYLGDDTTDVDVFHAFNRPGLPFKGLGIGVTGGEHVSRLAEEADFTLNGVTDVERFLKQVVAGVADRQAS